MNVNVVGIDYQRTCTLIRLREGAGPMARVQPVDDRERRLIPNAVVADRLWGSAALRSTEVGLCWPGDVPVDAPWPDVQGAGLFWRGVYRRLDGFLGRVPPTRESGYRVVVAVPAESDFPAVRSLAESAGLDDVDCIAAPQALLCRWLASAVHGFDEGKEQVIAAVAVGDTSVEVAAYGLSPSGGRLPRVTRTAKPVRLGGTGQAWWVARFRTLLMERVHDPGLLAGQELALRDAAIEMGARLARVADDRPIAWDGILAHRFLAPLVLTRAGCADWPEVAILNEQLPRIVRRVTADIGRGIVPDVVLVGGVGAVWPFARDAIGERVWQGEDPQGDLALGAAWWPDLGLAAGEPGPWNNTTILVDDEVNGSAPDEGLEIELPAGARPAIEVATAADQSDKDVVPPWERT